jgi:hypothetical protein
VLALVNIDEVVTRAHGWARTSDHRALGKGIDDESAHMREGAEGCDLS